MGFAHSALSPIASKPRVGALGFRLPRLWRYGVAAALALAICFPAALRAQTAGPLDLAFNPNVPPPGAGSDFYTVRATAVQPDGRIVVAGFFATVGGQPRGGIARLNPDGTVESAAAFNAGTGASGPVYSVVVQADGKILLGGSFTSVSGQSRSRIARLNADGTIESTATFNTGSGADDRVLGVAVQPDGKILVVGDFFYVNGVLRSSVARLQENGALESTATFNNGNGTNNGIAYCVAVQADGKILFGGDFQYMGSSSRERIARLNADGTGGSFAAGANSTVNCVAVQPDGKILIGGDFTTVNGQARAHIARLNADGTVESTATFNPGTGANGSVSGLALQADGKILLVGGFTAVNGQARNVIARLNADGTLESTATFNPGTGPGGPLPAVESVALQADGKILLGGSFATMNGQPRNKIARLNNDAATQSLTALDSGRVQWTRGGAAPEVEQVAFEVSTNGGVSWSALGAGTRIAGGWERTGLNLPASGAIRARGRTSGGYLNATSGMVEQVVTFTVTPSPEIAVELPAGTNLANGAGVPFPAVPGTNASRTFIIKNSGYADLTGLGITIDGPDAALFTVTASPTAPVAGPTGSTPFIVQFAHPSAGPRTATLHIASNDADENPFDFILDGRDALTNADLSNLVLSAGTLTPAFATASLSYTASVPFTTPSLTVTPTVADGTAIVQVNGVTVASGAASGVIALSVGSNLITVAVTAEDGVTMKTYAVTVARAAPVPGELDPAFDPNVAGTRVRATAVQPDGKTVVVGTFTTITGQARNKIARLNADGTLESTATFNPGTGADNDVVSVAVQADGKILLGGYFLNVNGQARTRIVRLLANGSVESTATFNAGTGASAGVESIAVQADGKIVLGGFFNTFNGQARNSIARLNADGTLESTATFNPGTGANGAVRSVVVQPDGKILLGGLFTSVNGQTRNYLARLNSGGTIEDTATFNPGAGASAIVNCLAVQPDGKILVGGQFATINGLPRNRIARLLADGSVESTATFNIGTGAEGGFFGVQSLAVQANGKILLGGDFTTVNGQARSGIARLQTDGSVESTATFDPGTGVNGPVYSVGLQADGKILLGGDFFAVNGQTRNRIARLANDAATQTLTVPGSTRVEWMRGGTAPEVAPVTFELSTNGGASWSALGAGVRIAGGWERSGLSLPASGSIRARGRATTGSWSGSSGIVEQVAPFPLVPEIGLEQPAGTPLADGTGSVSFGLITPPAGSARTFTIRNTGTADLTGLGIAIDGTNAADFAVTAAPTAPVPGPTGSTTFTVTFTPASAGAKTAALHLASNDADENPYDIALTGTGLTLRERWRLTYFGSIADSGAGADGNDPDGDGSVNVLEFATNRNPTQPGGAIGALVKNGAVLEFSYSRAKAAVLDGLLFTVEWSDTMLPGSWSSVDVTEAILSDDGTVQAILATLPAGTAGVRFVRLRVGGP